MIAGAMLSDWDYAVLLIEVLGWAFFWALGLAILERCVFAPSRHLSDLIPIFVPGLLAAISPVVILAYECLSGEKIEFLMFVFMSIIGIPLFGLSAAPTWAAFRLCRYLLHTRFI